MSVQVPVAVRARYMETLDHGQKQQVCTAGLLWYFHVDEQTQFAYRTWAQSIADGLATMDKPPEMIKEALEKAGRQLRPMPTRETKRGKKA